MESQQHPAIPAGTPLIETVGDRRSAPRPVERLRERGDVLAAVHRMLAGDQRHVARAVLVEGGAGYGKTAIVNAARTRAQQQGWTVASVECLPSDRCAPLSTAAALIGDERLDQVREHGPRGIRRALVELIESTPGNGVLVTIDNARFADEPTWDILLDLVARPPSTPFAIVLSAEPRPLGASVSPVDVLAAHPSTQVFRLRGLSDAAVAELLHERLPDRTVPPRVATVVARATGGCPALVHRAAARLAELRGPLDDALDGDRWVLPAPPVVSWVLGRLRDLPDDAISLLRAVAVLCDAGDLRAVEAVAVAFGGVADAATLVDQLVEREILVRTRSLEFLHPLVAVSIYEEIPPFARSTAHLLAAQQLRLRHRPEAEVAAHLLHTEPADEPSTVDALVDAARRLIDTRGDSRSAARFLARALAEPPQRHQLAEVLSTRAVLAALNGIGAPVADLHAAFGAADDPRQVYRTALEAVEAAVDTGVAAGIVALLTDLPDADTTIDPMDRSTTALHRLLLDGTPEARAALESVTEVLQRCSLTELARRPDATTVLQLAALASQLHRAADPDTGRLDEVLRLSHDLPVERLTASRVLARLLFDLVHLLTGAGETTRAAQLLDTALDVVVDPAGDGVPVPRGSGPAVAGRHGDVTRWLLVQRAILRAATGDLAGAERDVDEVLADGPTTDAALTAWLVRDHLHLARGGHLRAWPLPEVTPVVSSLATTWQHLQALELSVSARLAHGDRRGANAMARAARELATATRTRNPAVTSWRRCTSEVLHASGDIAAARGMAEAEFSAAVSFGAPRPTALALRALASTALDAGERVDLLRRANRALDGSELLLDSCRVLLDLGAAEHAAGHDDAARLTLRNAADLAVRLDAEAFITEAHHQLVAAGARPRRLSMSGVASLTPAERKVAGLAARGRKNTEIALELYISIKTVESHLARVYRKLEIDGRAQLVAQWESLVALADASTHEHG